MPVFQEKSSKAPPKVPEEKPEDVIQNKVYTHYKCLNWKTVISQLANELCANDIDHETNQKKGVRGWGSELHFNIRNSTRLIAFVRWQTYLRYDSG